MTAKRAPVAASITFAVLSGAVGACSNLEPSNGRESRAAAPAKGSAEAECKPAMTGLALIAATNYVTDIKPLLDQQCVSCHNSSANSAASPAFDTYESASANIVAALDSTTKGRMPPGAASFSGTAALSAWQRGGLLRDANSKPADGSDPTKGPAEDDIGTASTAGASPGTPGAKIPAGSIPQHASNCLTDTTKLEAKAAFDKCHEAGFLFDRKTNTCSDTAKVAAFPCTQEDAEVAFRQAGYEIRGRLQAALDEGYILRQCSGEPVMLLTLEKIAQLPSTGQWGVMVRTLDGSE